MPDNLAVRAVSEKWRTGGAYGERRGARQCGWVSASAALMQGAMPAAYFIEQRAAGFQGKQPGFVVTAEIVERLA